LIKDNQISGAEPKKKKSLKTKVPSNSNNTLDQEEITKKLTGKTLMVYFLLLNATKIGVRELQRQLDLSSPSLARYHLDKLTELKLAENRNGVYYLHHKAEIPVLSTWILLGHFIMPRVLFVAIYFSTLFFGYLIFFFSFWTKDSAFACIFGILFCGYSWLDVYWQYRHKPF
jgi:hypothetical protein